MALPKLDLPKHKHNLFGLGKEITYRGFTAKEQKILLEAKEGKENDNIRYSIEQIIDLCVYDDIDIKELAFFDIEDLFLRIRSRSVGEVVSLKYKVKETNPIEYVEFDLNLNDVKVTCHDNHSKKIILSEGNSKTIGVMMKYPTLSMIDSNIGMFDMIKLCIEYIFDDTEVYYIKDTPKQEFDEFIDSLDTVAMNKLKEFFETMPRLRYTQEVNLKSGKSVKLELEGLNDFFM